MVLAIAKELHRLLEKEPGFKPTLIRTGDYYVSLKGRRDLALSLLESMRVTLAYERQRTLPADAPVSGVDDAVPVSDLPAAWRAWAAWAPTS